MSGSCKIERRRGRGKDGTGSSIPQETVEMVKNTVLNAKAS